jgi:glycosyltransferase involved in cell wall biosynthesis
MGTPTVVVTAPDNAATELVEEGVNGFVVECDEPTVLAEAIVRIHEAGAALRASTAAWFEANAERLSIDASLDVVAARYAAEAPRS